MYVVKSAIGKNVKKFTQHNGLWTNFNVKDSGKIQRMPGLPLFPSPTTMMFKNKF